MSIFGSIVNKIFSKAGAATPASTESAGPGAAPAAVAGASVAAAAATAATTALNNADVEAILKDLAAAKGGGGNWRTSIVDLLKMLDLDSSLEARKELATELNVHAGAPGTAEQNIALSKAVWQQLARNGGKVPDSLKG